MSYLPPNFNLPPSVSDQMIEDHFGGDDNEDEDVELDGLEEDMADDGCGDY